MKALRGLTVVAVLAATLAAGIWLGANPHHLPAGVRDALAGGTGSLTAEAADLIQTNYFREVSGDELDDGSVNGMVQAVSKKHDDRFSHYFDPAAVERFDQAISGSFTGVGLTVTGIPRGLRVARVIAGAPAAAAGIKPGEVIVSVNGDSIAGKSVEEATALIKGPEGTEVELGVEPAAGGKARSLKITRAEVRLPPTRATMREAGGRKLGYLQFATFSRGASDYVRRAITRLRRQGAEGILLDLRGNGGGLLTEAILTASVFIPEGEVVVTTRSRSEGERVYKAEGGALEREPLVVLMNRDTASAAEILAAALDTDLDTPLVGTRSYGKGVFQKIMDLSNGGALDLTIGEYFTADGVSLAGKGLQPDVKVSDKPSTPPDEALQKGLEVLLGEVDSAGMAEEPAEDAGS